MLMKKNMETGGQITNTAAAETMWVEQTYRWT